MNTWKTMDPKRWGTEGAYRMLSKNNAVLSVAPKTQEMLMMESVGLMIGKGFYQVDPDEQITTITVWDRVVPDIETQSVAEGERPNIKHCLILRGDVRELFDGKNSFQEVETVFLNNLDKASALSGHEHYLAELMDQSGGVC